MSRILIVSNRLPVTVQQKGADLHYKTSEGGLATGLGAVYKQGRNLWIGWPGPYLNKEQVRQQVTEDLHRENMHPVFLTKIDIRDYYQGFSNETLWPAFHYFNQYITYNEQYWDAYVRVNQKFAQEVLKLAQPGDTIWVQDYQLLLLPQLLREKLPGCAIGFFLHIPFPSYEIFRQLPWREQLLQGMLGADLIGFHTFDYTRHFLSSVSRLLGHSHAYGQIETGTRTVLADAFPMGIDYEKYAGTAAAPETRKREATYRKALPQQQVILSIDRLDYTKGIAQRLLAFEQFLVKYPAFHEKVTLLMLVVPSRDQVPQYQQLKEQVDELVGRINASYRTMSWNPIQYFYRSFPLESLSALYRLADVALVTPMRDGMNLVAKEYVASRTNHRGVLILSELAGAAQELSDALLINPTNMPALVESLHTALTMPPEEQEQRMRSLQGLVKRYNVHHWVSLFMDRLAEVQTRQKVFNTRSLEGQPRSRLLHEYREAKQRLLFLDYDGTLAPFKAEPQQAKPDKELLQLLHHLSHQPATHVVIISGRDRHTLQEWLGHLPIDFISEHGVWIKEQHQDWHMQLPLLNDWMPDIRHVMELYVGRTPGSFIEEKDYSLVWHYRKIDPGLGELRSRELINHLTYFVANRDLQVLEGDKVIEVKNAHVNKGKATLGWQQRYPHALVLAIGDDWTDEDTFRAMPAGAYTIKVGNPRSAADYFLPSYKQVRALLKQLAESKVEVSEPQI